MVGIRQRLHGQELYNAIEANDDATISTTSPNDGFNFGGVISNSFVLNVGKMVDIYYINVNGSGLTGYWCKS